MARRFATDLDLLGYSLLNAMMNPVASDPGGLGVGHAGRVWYNSVDGSIKFWNGTAAINVKDRATGTGTQLAATISDLAATVKAYRLDEFAAPNVDVSLASHKLTNVTDGSGAQDAATKGQLDAAIAALTSGQVIKGAVVVAVGTNVVLATPGATLDGITMSNPMTVLLTAQTTGSQNGPYVWTGASTPLVRATNWDTTGEAVLGSYWVVEQGTHADTYALLTNDTAITLGTTTPVFAYIGGTSLTEGNGIDITAGVVSAVANTGITVSGSGIGADFGVVGRKFVGAIPAATAGAFTVSGSTVTINHALSNAAPVFVVRASSVPVSGYTAGQVVEMDNVSGDANNITLTLPANPATNNWLVTVIG